MEHSGAGRYLLAMKSILSRFAVLALVGCLTGAVPAAAGCLTASQAQKAVASGAVLRLGVIARAVGGEIVSAQLCESPQGPLIYQLAIMHPGGRIENIVVDATSGQRLR